MGTLIVGFSTRAIAGSAVASGHRVVTLDYFGDRDQRQCVENHSLMRDLGLGYSALALLETGRSLDYQEIVYTSNLENHPDVVDGLALGRTLLGNPSPVLRRVRDWRTLRAFCARSGILFPTTLLPGEERNAGDAGAWLLKPIRGGGGHGIRPWPGKPPDQAHFLQRFVPGQAASAAFVADGRRAVVLGLAEQLIGQEELGGRGFAWCGNILPLALPPPQWATVREQVESMVNQLTREFGLRGVNGVDLVISRDLQVYLVEVNPRYTASMELVEQAYGLNIFSLHLEAIEGRLPDWSLARREAGPWFGKGIVYARGHVTIPDTAAWLAGDRRDIPFASDRMGPGQPVCTVLARGMDRAGCWKHLVAAADAVRREIGDKLEA